MAEPRTQTALHPGLWTVRLPSTVPTHRCGLEKVQSGDSESGHTTTSLSTHSRFKAG